MKTAEDDLQALVRKVGRDQGLDEPTAWAEVMDTDKGLRLYVLAQLSLQDAEREIDKRSTDAELDSLAKSASGRDVVSPEQVVEFLDSPEGRRWYARKYL